MSLTPSISKAFAKVVTDTQTALAANQNLNWGTLPKTLTFMSGNILEVNARLDDMVSSSNGIIKNGMYPLIVLFKDINSKINIAINGFEVTFSVKIGIFVLTDPTYRHDERRDKNFIPILIPIMEELLRQLNFSTAFFRPQINDMGINATNCYYYGSELNNKNPFNDNLDAIELNIKTLRLKNIC